MESKEYRLGFLVGRFQIIHSGHEEIIRKAIELSGRTAVFVGSSQESGTAKNPFTYKMREEMLRRIFKDEIEIYPLPDLGAGNTCVWGKYVYQKVFESTGEFPDLFVSGEETRRNAWFPAEMYPGMSELSIPKTTDISASRMRQFLISGDPASWKYFTNPLLWDRYDELRGIILKYADVAETASI